jgi:hypothetical protein
MNYGPKTVTNGLVLCLDAADKNSYPGTGTSWNDLSGNNNTGSLTNGATFNSSNSGNIAFDGVDDCVVVNNNANILSKTAYTKTAWFYTTSIGPNNNIISGGNSGQHAFWLGGTSYLRAGHNGNWSTIVATTSMSVNTWYYGAVTFNTTTGWNLYLNGVQEATNVDTTTFIGNQEILIGAYSTGGNVFTGRIATSLVYNRVLTSTEILQNYNATKSRFGL